jgi:branched-chain amino acid transport system permease protein
VKTEESVTPGPDPVTAAGRSGTAARRTGGALRRNPRWLVLAVISVLAILAPFSINGYWLSTAVFVLIAAIGALGLDLLTGRTGQISLGHAFFLGVGAYTGGVIGGRYGLTAALWIPAAAVVAGLVGGLVGPTALRLRGLYLGIVTIGLIFIGQHLFVNISFVSGGPGGEALPVPTFGSLNFAQGVHVGGLFINRDGLYYYLVLLLLTAAMAYVYNLGRSRHGRSMGAVRDRELAAAVLGVDVARTKVMAFVISSMLAGLSGALYGSYLGFVVPTQWSLPLSIEYVVMIVVGGMATVWGPVLGAFVVIGLPALLQNVSGSLPFLKTGTNAHGILTVSDASAIAYGVFLVVFLLLEPRGLVGLGQRLSRLARRRAPQLREARPPLPASGGS